jgi:hypothetical protein
MRTGEKLIGLLANTGSILSFAGREGGGDWGSGFLLIKTPQEASSTAMPTTE